MEDFNAQFFEMMVGIHDMAPVARQFVVIPMLIDSLPDWVVERIDHGFNLWGLDLSLYAERRSLGSIRN
jgi:hypothetical protein